MQDGIKLSVNAERTQRMLQNLARLIGDTRIPNKKVSIELYRITMRNFSTEGVEVTGAKWEPLKAGGRWRGEGKKRKKQTNYKILQDTGQLRASFLPFSDKDKAGVGAERLSRSDGAPSDLAKIHQEGLGSMPQREMLPRIEPATKLAVTIYKQHINDSIARGKR